MADYRYNRKIVKHMVEKHLVYIACHILLGYTLCLKKKNTYTAHRQALLPLLLLSHWRLSRYITQLAVCLLSRTAGMKLSHLNKKKA